MKAKIKSQTAPVTNPAAKVIDYYATCHRLKDTIRTGWMRWDVKRGRLESVAEHVFGTQMLAIAMKSEFHYDIDIEKVILMLAIHEIGEAVIGDFIPFDITRAEKERLEHAAVADVLAPLIDGAKINALFEEFDARETPEAKFAYQCDKLECDIQCKFYDEEVAYDVANLTDPNILQDPLIRELASSTASWSEMWLKYDQAKVAYDPNFLAVSNYLLTKHDHQLLLSEYKLDPALVQHIMIDIFPEYAKNDCGHQLGHIWYVIRRSLKFAETIPDINYNMVFAIAAFHDLKKHISREKHEILSAEALKNDEALSQFFTPAEITTMSEAVADHRASLKGEPRSIYGKIVSSADRSTSLDAAIKRTLLYLLEKDPAIPLDEMTDYTFTHLVKKFGQTGYAKSKCYFDDPEYQAFLEDVAETTATRAKFQARVTKVLQTLKPV